MKEISKHNATKEEVINTCEETFGKKDCHEETYYNSQSEGKEFKDSFYSPEEWGTWQTETEEITT
jgi:predicted NAD/FAD-binding protein